MEDMQAKKVLGHVVAIIPARGGSKRFPGKNVMLFKDKPLIYHTIEAAQQCPLINRTIVTTEDPEIKRVAASFGAEVIDRPKRLSSDDAKSAVVVAHALSLIPADYFVFLQPTSPLRNSGHIADCLHTFVETDARSAVSVTVVEHHPYKMIQPSTDGISALFDIRYLDMPDQKLPLIYRLNGAIYLAPVKLFLQRNSFFLDPVMPYFMSPESSIDINTHHDLRIAEAIGLER